MRFLTGFDGFLEFSGFRLFSLHFGWVLGFRLAVYYRFSWLGFWLGVGLGCYSWFGFGSACFRAGVWRVTLRSGLFCLELFNIRLCLCGLVLGFS